MSKPLEGLRVLIAEDEEPAARALEYDLQRIFPNSKVDIASNVADGFERLNAAYDNSTPYQVAILDFKLPPNKTDQNPVPDFSIGRAFRDLMPETLLISVTAYQDDPEIKQYINRKDTMTEAGRLFVAKERGWIKLVCEEIARSLHTRRIRQRFNQLFLSLDMPATRIGSRRTGVHRSDRRRSHEIAELCADAGDHWEFLTAGLQHDLDDVLGHVQGSNGTHLVGVVKADSDTSEGEESQDLEI